MKYSYNMKTFSMIPLMLSLLLLHKNMYFSMEIPMININSMFIPMSFMFDWMSFMFMSTVMFISSMIMTFSMYYIPKKEHKNFIMLLMMFVLSMMILIISDNIIFILLGWDGLGLSSYILVIYYQNFSSAASGSITLISNRVGDIMILLAISIMMMNFNWNFNMNMEFNLMSLILLTIAASSKSAQFPFSAWLPAAMAAPTPISALVHSSTLVTAGVFLLIRIINNPHPTILLTLMISSSATAIYAGMAANWEQDMKKIIALSTLSQMAMMMFAISMKSSLLAFFHLIIHALFKSTMFLCAGIMIHNSSYQDMRMMGMSSTNFPLMCSVLGISSMALMGIPFMSGFFSKDMIIELMIMSKYSSLLTQLMIMSIGLTASYTFRMSILSNKFTLKSKPDSNMHNNNYANISITLMIPLSIMLGSMMIWILNPQQLFIFPLHFKMMIILNMTLGIILGLTLSFKNKNFIKMGEFMISLWFNHFITTSLMNKSTSTMKKMLNNDLMWQEMYGPQGTFLMIKKYSYIPIMMMMLMMLTLIMLTMLPWIIY